MRRFGFFVGDLPSPSSPSRDATLSLEPRWVRGLAPSCPSPSMTVETTFRRLRRRPSDAPIDVRRVSDARRAPRDARRAPRFGGGPDAVGGGFAGAAAGAPASAPCRSDRASAFDRRRSPRPSPAGGGLQEPCSASSGTALASSSGLLSSLDGGRSSRISFSSQSDENDGVRLQTLPKLLRELRRNW